MKRSMNRLLLAALAAASIALAPFPGATAPLVVPDRGLTLHGVEQQSYIRDVADRVFHPQEGAAHEAFAAPDGWTWEQTKIGGVPVDHMSAAQQKTKRVLLQLHGGGYVLGMSDAHRRLAMRQAVLTDAAEVYCVDYRTAPTYMYPAALEDAVAVYRGLIARGIDPAHIILVGDSAGGNLALELLLDLKSHDEPMPGVLLLASPWATFVHEKGTSRTTNADKDAFLGTNTPLYDAVAHAVYAPELALTDPRVSPVYADLTGLPPMLIQTGGDELFLTENEDLARKAAANGVTVTLTVYPGMPHDFALLLPELDESVQSLHEMADFVRRHMN
ncbi:alpha/beta hydrolase [Selenomonas sp. F0473]|uniref:alpha/beta hydrolase n=1 Tax=Selenomonas sp. F0473 TaxID=999423 RepID=UPI00029E0472|nr:alpha/beta hydrolase [Selenomonas sp. F0473]EKU71227.1 hypothetical protein HMPREF9161_01321 [Selenomonas sp. F0473]